MGYEEAATRAARARTPASSLLRLREEVVRDNSSVLTPASSLQRLREEMVCDKEKNYGGEMMANLMRCVPRH